MTADEITQYLTELNDELRQMDVKGEVSLYGGAVMCLVYDARPATKDVDAIFKPTVEIRKAILRIADRHGLNENWFNDAVKGYWVEHKQLVLFDLPNLTVFVPEPDYLLAMKSISARDATYDRDDVRTLINVLGLTKPEEVFSIIEKYYPRNQIKPATQYFIEEIFQK
ncbi:MAG: DUF6036 family nucleotidyltransferase [Pyrinomonadaceae bacterium]